MKSMHQPARGIYLAFSLAAGLLLFPQAAFAWDAMIHRLIVRAAVDQLADGEREVLASLLAEFPLDRAVSQPARESAAANAHAKEFSRTDEPGPAAVARGNALKHLHQALGRAAVFADAFRSTPAGEYTRDEHSEYIRDGVSFSPEAVQEGGEVLRQELDRRSEQGSLIDAITRKYEPAAADLHRPAADRAFAIVMLLHLYADSAQPFHLSGGPASGNLDFGGIATYVRLFENQGGTVSLHSLFDGFVFYLHDPVSLDDPNREERFSARLTQLITTSELRCSTAEHGRIMLSAYNLGTEVRALRNVYRPKADSGAEMIRRFHDRVLKQAAASSVLIACRLHAILAANAAPGPGANASADAASTPSLDAR